MKRDEIDWSRQLLEDRIDRSEILRLESSDDCDSYALSVQWIHGGQRMFYDLAHVLEHVGCTDARTWNLISCKINMRFSGTLLEAIAKAKEIDEEYQPYGGVNIEEITGQTIIHIDE